MLSRDMDVTILGKSFLSFIFALDLLDRGKSVLLLDDERMGYGPLYTDSVGLLEKKYLQMWGQDQGIEPLKNIDKYLSFRPLTLISKNKRIRLGDMAARNLTELARKMPFCFEDGVIDRVSANHFNQLFDSFCQKVASDGYSLEMSEKRVNFFCDVPDDIKKIFFPFFKYMAEKESSSDIDVWNLKTFVYMARGFFQNNLSFVASEFEFFYLFISLLSPRFKLDHESLLNDLSSIYYQRGGQFRKTRVSEWIFHKGSPWSIELASYEGIIRPKEMFLFGSSPKKLPFEFTPRASMYTSVKVTLKFSKKNKFRWNDEHILFSSLDKIGTDHPVWEASFNDDQLVCRFFCAEERGVKIEFIKDEIRQILLNDLLNIIDCSHLEIVDERMEFADDVWLDGREMISKTNGKNKIFIHETSDKGKKSVLKNIHYFGPYHPRPYGFFSSLVELKQFVNCSLSKV